MHASSYVYTRAKIGIEAPLIRIEAHITNGLPQFLIVGLPKASVKESRDRVRSAILNSGFDFPLKRLTINLAPADLPKEGSGFDLPIAIAILAASEQLNTHNLMNYEYIGELGLLGTLTCSSDLLQAACTIQKDHRTLISGSACNRWKKYASILCFDHLKHVHRYLIQPSETTLCALTSENPHIESISDQADTSSKTMHHLWIDEPSSHAPATLDFSDVVGQSSAKRMLEIAACGGHNILMFGPPGSGKSMLADRFPTILPPMSEEEIIEVMSIYACAGYHIPDENWNRRPFRAPHHTTSSIALVGGGNPPKPGEVSLAHCGVLFLDELLEFKGRTLEVLREPIESGKIMISRSSCHIHFPSNFQWICATNPCPCGGGSSCRCTSDQIQRYRQKLSGPLLDRIDMHVHIAALKWQDLTTHTTHESSHHIRQRVLQARAIQQERQGRILNSKLTGSLIKKHCILDLSAHKIIESMQSLPASACSSRAYHRILKVARTIADMEGSDRIQDTHLTEAWASRHWSLGRF